MSSLEQAVLERRSTRLFLPDRPVPRELVVEALELAMHAPSNSNVQPWRVVLASGAARDRLVAALLARASAGPPAVPELPDSFAHLRRELGALVYGSMGIGRHDLEARRAAVRRNWEFFGAPVGGVVCMHRDLGLADAVGVGMFLQTLLLALTARGIDTCVEVSIAGYPETVREELSIDDDLRILCGVAIGYAAPDFPANTLRVPRNPLAANVTFVDE